MEKVITRKRMMAEVAIKHVAILVFFWGFYIPMSVSPMQQISPEYIESVISFMGFLMAAAIIGAFELSYTRTRLNDGLQRYLAHFTKFTLYSSIFLMMEIALVAISVADSNLVPVMIMASSPVCAALFLYDYWDALRAVDS